MRRWVTGLALALIALTAAVTLGSHKTFADKRDFTLVNGSDYITIVHAYVSPASTNDWEEDILHGTALEPGDTFDVTFSGYDSRTCLFDVRVDGAGGERGVLYGVDLCSTDTVTFS